MGRLCTPWRIASGDSETKRFGRRCGQVRLLKAIDGAKVGKAKVEGTGCRARLAP